MSNYRVIESGTNCDGFMYTIEDVMDPIEFGVHHFVSHEPHILSAFDIRDLKIILEEMLEACDKPAMRVIPEKLIELVELKK